MKKHIQPLEPDCFYHIFNRAHSHQKAFLEEENYLYFLKKYKQYISPYADTYAYCLLPNHFHFLIRTKPLEKLELHTESQDIAMLYGRPFNSLFKSYSQSINERYDRNGSLFERPFKRVPIRSDSYLTRVIAYIHLNPLKHHIQKDFEYYKYSSYSSILSSAKTSLKRREVLEWFGGIASFVNFHKTFNSTDAIKELTLES